MSLGDVLNLVPETSVYGYRAWLAEDGKLTPVIQTQASWDRRAVCLNTTPKLSMHVPPEPKCGCGYWMFSTYDRLDEVNPCSTQNRIRCVWGIAAGWGKAVVCEYGWRTQYAKPVALLAWPKRRAFLDEPFDPAKHQADADKWNAEIERLATELCLPLCANPGELVDEVAKLRATLYRAV